MLRMTAKELGLVDMPVITNEMTMIIVNSDGCVLKVWMLK